MTYGTQKSIGELWVEDFSRRGWVDGRAERMLELVQAVGRVYATLAADLLGWAPYALIEALFGCFPPLVTPRAQAAGFRPDSDLDTLVRHALALGCGLRRNTMTQMPVPPPILDGYWKIVAKAGSLSKSATALVMPQSVVSRSIGHQERQCGARLFERTGRGVTLT
jgi:hypothetical protein